MKQLLNEKAPNGKPEREYSIENISVVEKEIFNTASDMPPNQEADDSSHELFVSYLSAKQQKLSTYTSGWSSSLFQQFYRPLLDKGAMEAVVKEAKAYVHYFISDYAERLSPCYRYISRQNAHCSYQEMLRIIEDISCFDQAYDYIDGLHQFLHTTEAVKKIYQSILRIYRDIYQSDFYQDLQIRFCNVEIKRIDQKYRRSRLPLLNCSDPGLQQALNLFEDSYETLGAASELARDVRIKLIPIINELTAGFQDAESLAKIISAVDDVTKRIREVSGSRQLEKRSFQLEIDLELLRQITYNL